MNKINNRGIGHHVLVIAIAVTAVTGAAGFFIWQRQENNNLEAKAAGYTDLSRITPIGSKGSSSAPKVAWYACKRIANRSGTEYYVRTLAKNASPGAKPTVSVGYDGRVMYKKGFTNTAVTLPEIKIKSTGSFDVGSNPNTAAGASSNAITTTYSLKSVTATC